MTTEPARRLRLPAATGHVMEPARPPSHAPDGALIPLPLAFAVTITDAAAFTVWSVKLPAHYKLDDALNPALWRKVEIELRSRPRKPAAGDLMRVVRRDFRDGAEDFDALFLVTDIQPGVGYSLKYYAGLLPEGATA